MSQRILADCTEGSTPQTDNPIPKSVMLSSFHDCSEVLVTDEIY